MDSIDWIIINKSLDGSLNDQESEILSEWLAESAEHYALYQKIKAYDSYSLSDEKFAKSRRIIFYPKCCFNAIRFNEPRAD